jgi:hypothetical protein
MLKNINLSKVLNVVLVALIALLLTLGTCKNRGYQNQQSTIDSITLVNQQLTKTISLKGDTIHMQEAIVTSSQDAIQNLTKERFNLDKKHQKEIKAVHAYYRGITVTKIDSIDVPYVDTVATKKFSDSVTKACKIVIDYMKDSTVTIGTTAGDTTKNYIINATILKNKLKVNTIQMIDTQDVQFVEIRGGFLKRDIYGKRKLFSKRYIRVDVTHTNDYLKLLHSNSIYYIQPKKKNTVRNIAILAVGAYIGTRL